MKSSASEPVPNAIKFTGHTKLNTRDMIFASYIAITKIKLIHLTYL